MADFHRSFIKAMDLIEDARQAGHLIDAEHYYEKYRNSSDKSYIQQAFDGVTSNPLFEQFSGLQWTYVIKSGVSASYAINHLLQEHETYIECGVALNISHYLIVLWAMEEVHGKEQGSKRFDSLFGQADAVTPSNRRLIINPANILMGTSIPSDMKQLPVHPLSFFSEKSQGVDKQKINNFAKVGDMIVFLGDPNYVKIHPAGMHAIYNCVITSLNPIKVRCFDLGKQELTQEDLYQQHQQAYSAVPLLESFALLDKNFRNSLEFIELITQPTSPEKIPGFYNRLFSINQEKFNFLIKGEMNKVMITLDKYLTSTYEKVKKNKEQNDLLKMTQELSLQLQAVKLDEQKPTVLMPKIERNAKMNSEVETVKVKEPYLPGFAKGFLTSKSAVSSNNSVESQQEKKANKSNT